MKPPRKRFGEQFKFKDPFSIKWSELMNRGDRVGIRYLHVEKLKRKRKLTKDERVFLKKFEADRKLIARDPEAAWKKGFNTAHRGLMLLGCLIYERWSQNRSEENDHALDCVLTMYSFLLNDVQQDIVRYAEEGSKRAAHAVFRDGKKLASAFSRLAIAKPELFREFAEESLTMPSLRGRNPNFTCDAAAIIEAIHLGEKHHANDVHDNRSRIGAFCHLFVAEIVDIVEGARLEAIQKGNTDSECFDLPALKGNAKIWWASELKWWVHREFERMKKNPNRNPALWKELDKITDGGTDSAKRAALEKYCFNKLEQIAGK